MGWVINATPAALPQGKEPGIRYTGGWVGPRGGLNEFRKSRLHWNSILGSDSSITG